MAVGTIISNIESIDSIHWTQLRKGRVTAARRVVALDDTSVIIELANGEFTVAGRRHTPEWQVGCAGLWFRQDGQEAVLDGLASLGIITKDGVKAHVKVTKAKSEERERKFAEQSLIAACNKLGIPVPTLEGN